MIHHDVLYRHVAIYIACCGQCTCTCGKGGACKCVDVADALTDVQTTCSSQSYLLRTMLEMLNMICSSLIPSSSYKKSRKGLVKRVAVTRPRGMHDVC